MSHSIQGHTVQFGIYPSTMRADRAIRDLLAAGFGKDQITVIAPADQHKHFENFQPHATDEADVSGAAVGAGLGAAQGSLGVLAAGLITGGVMLLALGPIAAGAGGAVGGLLGALTKHGVNHDVAVSYEREVASGKILVAVETDGADGGDRQRDAL